MIRVLSNKTSALIRVAVSVLAGLLFADAVNLDDLLSNAIVLHSDEEVTAQATRYQSETFSSHVTPASSTPAQLRTFRIVVQDVKASIILVDQDSPSVEAEHSATVPQSALFPRQKLASYLSPEPTGPLYLKLRVLLI